MMIAWSCHSWSTCPVMLVLDLLPSHVTPGAFTDAFTSPSGVLLSPSQVIPGALGSHVTSWALGQSCHSWSTCPVASLLELLPANLQVPAAYCFRPVVSLLYLLPRHVTPGALADVFTSHSGVLLSLSNVIFVHSASCGIRVPASCLVSSETLYASASGFFLWLN